MKKDLKNNIIDLIPNVEWLKRLLSKIRVYRVKKRYISKMEVELGEADVQKKKEIVEKYKKSWGNYLKPTISMTDKLLQNVENYKSRDDQEELLIDMIFCRLAYGFQPDEYLCFELEKQPMNQRKQWISDLDRYVYIYAMNDIKDAQLFNNKARTYTVFKKYYRREAISVKNPRDYKTFLTFIKKYPIFVKKRVYEGMGRSVELIDIHKAGMSANDYFNKLISQGEHILEEKIQQHEILASLNASSVNTVRCITFRTKDSIYIPFCFMKIGRNGSFVDNGGAGGLLVLIDPANGRFISDAYDENNICYAVHPDTKVEFKGYQLPEWDKLLCLCKEASAVTPSVRCIGWDWTYTDQGWTMVEGNGMTQMIGPQITQKKGTKAETLKIMRNMDLIVNV